MKIREVTTHIAVEWGPRRASNRHFSIENDKKFKNLSLELIKDLGIRISNEEDDIVVPFVNITHIKLGSPPQVEPVSKSEASVMGFDEPDEEELESQEVSTQKTWSQKSSAQKSKGKSGK